MTPDQLRHFQALLLSLRRGLLGRGSSAIEPNRKDDAEVGEDEDEQPLNEMLQAIASDRNRTAAATLVRLDKALKKLRERPDDFGLCEECDDELPEGRLKAMPYAELCLDCQAKRDPRGPQTRRSPYEFR